MRDRKEGKHLAGVIALLLVGAAVVLAACGGSASTTTASAPATTPAPASQSQHGKTTGAHHARTTGTVAPVHKLSAAARAAIRTQTQLGRRVGRKACAGLTRANALAHIVPLAKAAEKRHHVPVRAGMLARVQQLPKSALQGRAAPAMAAAIIAAGQPVKQRAGAFTGCLTALLASH